MDLRRTDDSWPGLAVLTIDIKLISSKRKQIFQASKQISFAFKLKSYNMKKISADMIASEANWKCSLQVMASRPLGQADVRVQYQLSRLRIVIIVKSYDVMQLVQSFESNLKVMIPFQLTAECKWSF